MSRRNRVTRLAPRTGSSSGPRRRGGLRRLRCLAAVAKRLDVFGVAFVGWSPRSAAGSAVTCSPGSSPVFLRHGIYAVASLLGAVAVVGLDRFDLARPLLLPPVAVGVFGLRLLAPHPAPVG